MTWPTDLYDFAFIPEIDVRVAELAGECEVEDWEYHNTTATRRLPVLYNYVRYTYTRISEENKIALSDDGQFACFNTGLVTPSQEPLFASFEVNRREAAQLWYFKGWFRKGQWELNKFPELPDIAHYFEDPSVLVFDSRRDFRINVEHIVQENRDRFPDHIKTMSDFQLQNLLEGAIHHSRERVRRNYKTAIPQYYRGSIQILLPLCLTAPDTADLALVVERHSTFYRASTCLTLDMAYNNARQLAKPEREWLKP